MIQVFKHYFETIFVSFKMTRGNKKYKKKDNRRFNESYKKIAEEEAENKLKVESYVKPNSSFSYFKKDELNEMKDLLRIDDLKERHILLGAVAIGHFDAVKKILKQGYPINCRGESDLTPLMWAVRCKRLEMIEFLINRDADILATNANGDNAMLLAIQSAEWDEDTFLDFWDTVSRYSGDIDETINYSNKKGFTLLHYSVKRQWKNVLDRLIENGADVNCANNQGVTPLMMAGSRADRVMEKKLLLSKADILLEDKKGCTALCYSIAFMIQKQLEAPDSLFQHFLTQMQDALSNVKSVCQIRSLSLELYLKRRLDLLVYPPDDNFSQTITDVIVHLISFFKRFNQIGFELLLDLQVFVRIQEAIERHNEDMEYIMALMAVTLELVRVCKCCVSEKLVLKIGRNFLVAGIPDTCLQILKKYSQTRYKSIMNAAIIPLIAVCMSSSPFGKVWLQNNSKHFIPIYQNYIKSNAVHFNVIDDDYHKDLLKKSVKDFKKIVLKVAAGKIIVKNLEALQLDENSSRITCEKSCIANPTTLVERSSDVSLRERLGSEKLKNCETEVKDENYSLVRNKEMIFDKTSPSDLSISKKTQKQDDSCLEQSRRTLHQQYNKVLIGDKNVLCEENVLSGSDTSNKLLQLDWPNVSQDKNLMQNYNSPLFEKELKNLSTDTFYQEICEEEKRGWPNVSQDKNPMQNYNSPLFEKELKNLSTDTFYQEICEEEKRGWPNVSRDKNLMQNYNSPLFEKELKTLSTDTFYQEICEEEKRGWPNVSQDKNLMQNYNSPLFEKELKTLSTDTFYQEICEEEKRGWPNVSQDKNLMQNYNSPLFEKELKNLSTDTFYQEICEEEKRGWPNVSQDKNIMQNYNSPLFEKELKNLSTDTFYQEICEEEKRGWPNVSQDKNLMQNYNAPLFEKVLQNENKDTFYEEIRRDKNLGNHNSNPLKKVNGYDNTFHHTGNHKIFSDMKSFNTTLENYNEEVNFSVGKNHNNGGMYKVYNEDSNHNENNQSEFIDSKKYNSLDSNDLRNRYYNDIEKNEGLENNQQKNRINFHKRTDLHIIEENILDPTNFTVQDNNKNTISPINHVCSVNKLEKRMERLNKRIMGIVDQYETLWRDDWEKGYVAAKGDERMLLELMINLPYLEQLHLQLFIEKWNDFQLKLSSRNLKHLVSILMKVETYLIEFAARLEHKIVSCENSDEPELLEIETSLKTNSLKFGFTCYENSVPIKGEQSEGFQQVAIEVKNSFTHVRNNHGNGSLNMSNSGSNCYGNVEELADKYSLQKNKMNYEEIYKENGCRWDQGDKYDWIKTSTKEDAKTNISKHEKNYLISRLTDKASSIQIEDVEQRKGLVNNTSTRQNYFPTHSKGDGDAINNITKSESATEWFMQPIRILKRKEINSDNKYNSRSTYEVKEAFSKHDSLLLEDRKTMYSSKRFTTTIEKLITLESDKKEVLDYGTLTVAVASTYPEFKLFDGGNFGVVELGLDRELFPLAVKKIIRYKKKTVDMITSTLKTLLHEMRNLHHTNIVPYVNYIENECSAMIVLPLCEKNLEDLIGEMKHCDEFETYSSTLVEQMKTFLTEDFLFLVCNFQLFIIFKGLHYLHTQKPPIIHGNLKPTNVLIDSKHTVRLADFGLHKILYRQKSPLVDGFIWWAQETYVAYKSTLKINCTLQSDIQVAGMLMHYIMTRGVHPLKKMNNCKAKDSFILVPAFHTVNCEVNDLLTWMFEYSACNRPSISQALSHICFWSVDRRWEYILACSGVKNNYLESSLPMTKFSIFIDKQTIEQKMDGNWIPILEQNFPELSFSSRHGTYSGLLQLIRLCTLNTNVNLRETIRRVLLDTSSNTPLCFYRLIQGSEWETHPELIKFFQHSYH